MLIEIDCNYVVIGKEVGESGTPHLQGYIEFPNAKRLETLKNLHNKIHWEARKGTASQAANYCKKDKVFEERGEISRQGERTDLNGIGAKILTGASINEIMEENPGAYIKYHRGINAMKNATLSHRSEKPNTFYIHGVAGVGKTRSVHDKHDAKDIYIKNNNKWWDGYNQQKVILIDDFDPKGWNFKDLLKLLDRYHYEGEVKGGHIKINSPYIYITCDKHPREFWSGNDYDQFIRRIDTIQHMEKKCDTDVTKVAGNTEPPQKIKIKIPEVRKKNVTQIKIPPSDWKPTKLNFH